MNAEQPAQNDDFLVLDDVSRLFKARQSMWETEARVQVAVDRVSLTLKRGEIFGLVGESGCGKSTLAKIICRLLAPSSGTVYMQGRSIWPAEADFVATLPQKIQMVFQDPASSLNPRMKVTSAIEEVLIIQQKGDASARKARVDELLRLVGLSAEQGYPHEMSGGQRQRIAIARALAADPELILCDEPISSLDVSIQAQVINLLKDLQVSLGLTYLFISHDLAVISAISDRIGVMCSGRMVEVARTADLLAGPRHPYSRLLLASAPDPYADLEKRRAQADPNIRKRAPTETSPLDNQAQTCPFLARCPDKIDLCCRERPPDNLVGAEHMVNCHLSAAKVKA